MTRIQKEVWDEELRILFGTLHDGLKQEVRQRSLAQLILPGELMSLTEEREAQIKASLAFHLRTVGFLTHVESYFYGEPAGRRPDFAILLPASKRYLFLECKVINPYYGFSQALQDIDKLSKVRNYMDRRNGLVCLGFRDPTGPKERFPAKYKKLSRAITSKYPYREVGVEKIDLGGLDEKAEYAMLGLWIRTLR